MIYRTAAVAACLALFACKGGDDTDPSDPPIGPSCETVSNQFPADQAQGVYYRTAFSWTFTAADQSAAVALTGPGGDVAGTSSWVGNTFVWTPSAPLESGTMYNLTLSSCDGAQMADSTFTTSAIGTNVPDASLAGRSYLLDLTDPTVNFIEPPGIGGLLQQQLTDVFVIVGVNSANATDIDMIGAIGETIGTSVQQDLCTESIPFPLAGFDENPYFEIGPETTTFNVAGLSVAIGDLKITGAFAADGSVIAGAVLEGEIDTRPLVDLFDEGGADDAVCMLVAQFGFSCNDCGNGEEFCLSLKVNNINAEELPGVTVVERTTAIIDADTVGCPPPVPPPVP